MFVERFHSFIIIIYPIVCVSLIFRQEWINLEASFASTLWKFLVLVADEIEQVDRFDRVIEMSLVACRRNDLIPTSLSGSPYNRSTTVLLAETVLCNIFELQEALVIVVA